MSCSVVRIKQIVQNINVTSSAFMGEILSHYCLESSVKALDDACFDIFVLTDVELNSQVGESSLKDRIQEHFALVHL